MTIFCTRNIPLDTRIFFKIGCVIACVLLIGKANAERYSPRNGDDIIASWPVVTSPALQKAQTEKRLHPNDPSAVVALANNYLALANKPGESRLYGLAQASLKPLIESNTNNLQAWLTWAQVLQHQHQFNESLDAIAKVLAQDPKNINANLLSARIYLIQDKPQQARQSCLKLLGYSDLLTTSVCVLEITSHQPGKLQESYNQLIAMADRQGFPGDERGPWLAQVLADMAMRLGEAKAAADWLAPQLNTASVNYLAQWADTQFAQQRYQPVIDYLVPIVQAAPEVDDLLLLQLSIAEKNTGSKTDWQSQLAKRVALREQRQDSQHANELARYYLDVNPQPQKALHWAQLHFENSRETADKELLARAKTAQEAAQQTAHQATQPAMQATAQEGAK